MPVGHPGIRRIRVCIVRFVPQLRIREAAEVLGVSDDTVRRWIDSGRVAAEQDSSGRTVVDGASLARHAAQAAHPPADRHPGTSSARNRLVGLVTRVTADTVMAEVEMQCGPFTIVSLMSSESARALEPGAVAVAVVKATTVIVETP